MKRKASGQLRARINTRGNNQEVGVHFQEDKIAALAVDETTIKVLFVQILQIGHLA